MNTLLVALGGAVGASLRHLAGQSVPAPWGTLMVNVSGSFLMGLLAAWLVARDGTGEGARLLLGVGLLGGFTTFSAFSLDAVRLVEAGRLGGFALYVGSSVGAGILALVLGLALGRSLA